MLTEERPDENIARMRLSTSLEERSHWKLNLKCFDHGLLASRIVKKQISFVKPSSLWYFIIEALAD